MGYREEIKLTLFLRNSKKGKSVEKITHQIKKNLPKTIDARIHKIKKPSSGFLNKIINTVEVVGEQGDINHVTGDINYITYFLRRKKTVLTILDCEKLMGIDYGPIKKALYNFFWLFIPQLRCSRIITLSNESKVNISKYAGININKIRVCYPGVGEQFKKLNLDIKKKYRLLGNKLSKKIVFHISTLKTNKNIDRLIKALVGLDIRFIKVGDLTKEHLTELRESKIDFIQLKDICEEKLIKIYNLVDCLVFPSLVEGFGLPVVEAQACGCPVVTSNCSSLPEVAGCGAIYVNPLSVESIREGIRKALYQDNLRKKVIEEGFKNVERFRYRNLIKQYYRIYEDVYHRNT